MKLGALHPITGRQWELTDERANAIWPDCVLVVPFSARAKDSTGKVINDAPGVADQGGWTVTSELIELELHDLVEGTVVADVGAVWTNAPDGSDTPTLHVLGEDPFAWLSPHVDVPASVATTSPGWRDQGFGTGAPATSTAEQRFGELVVVPEPELALLPGPLGSRTLCAPDAKLRFSWWSGLPILVDGLQLAVLTPERQGLEGLPDGWKPVAHVPLGGPLMLWLVELDLPTAVSEVVNPWPGLVAFVRYRHAAATTHTPERVTLKPGHYELRLKGHTDGEAPQGSGMQACDRVDWGVTQRFWVDHPPSLRPYVATSTVGDDRIFGRRAGFDPTLPGVGFPAHRGYRTAVRFKVPYVRDMFPDLWVTGEYRDGRSLGENVVVTSDPDGASSLPPASQTYQAINGGTVAPDDEVTPGTVLDQGPAELRLRHQLPDGTRVQLDAWAIQVSRFGGAAEHLAWASGCVTTCFGPSGPVTREPCPTIAGPLGEVGKVIKGGGRVHRMHDLSEAPIELLDLDRVADLVATGWAGKLLEEVGPIVGGKLPPELTTPPADWVLEPALAELTGPPDHDAAQRFVRFLHRTGARLATGSGPALQGLATPVGQTVVHAVAGADPRPLALWLRTPEPLDWRRVTASASIRHVEPAAGCPTGYARRRRLETGVRIVPSVDGSQALLVLDFAGQPIRVPRGEVSIALRYDPRTHGLVALRPRTPLADGVEKVTLTFVQPFGSPWPQPPSGGGKGIVIDPDDLVVGPKKIWPWDLWGPFDPRFVNPGEAIRRRGGQR